MSDTKGASSRFNFSLRKKKSTSSTVEPEEIETKRFIDRKKDNIFI